MGVAYAMHKSCKCTLFLSRRQYADLIDLSSEGLCLLQPQAVMPSTAQWASIHVSLEYSSCYVALHILPAMHYVCNSP